MNWKEKRILNDEIKIRYIAGSEFEQDIESITKKIIYLVESYLKILKVSIKRPIILYIYQSYEDMEIKRGKTNNFCNTQRNEAYYIYGQGIYSPFGHELVHLLSAPLFGKITESNKNMFEALAMGLAPTPQMVNRFYEITKTSPQLDEEIFSFFNSTQLTLDEMVVLAFFVRFLIFKFGIDDFINHFCENSLTMSNNHDLQGIIKEFLLNFKGKVDSNV